jgi:hypothetical protein
MCAKHPSFLGERHLTNISSRKANNETEGHKQAKYLLASKLQDWFGVALTEYAADGHKADTFSVTTSGIEIFAEVIWDASESNVNRDIVLIQRSNAKVKLLVVNPAILEKEALVREFQKTIASERTKGTVFVGPIDAGKLLTDSGYVETEFKTLVKAAVESACKNSKSSGPAKAMIWAEDYNNGIIEDVKAEEIEDTGIYLKGGNNSVIRNVHLKGKPGSKSTGIHVEV